MNVIIAIIYGIIGTLFYIAGKSLRPLSKKDYVKMILLSIFWPLIFVGAVFESFMEFIFPKFKGHL